MSNLVNLLAFTSSIALSPASAAVVPPYCWRFIQLPEAMTQVGLLEPALAATDRTIWIAWEAKRVQLGRRVGAGSWEILGSPAIDVRGAREPFVAAIGEQDVILGFKGDAEQGKTKLYLARWSEGQWRTLSPPLLSLEEPFTHVEDKAFALAPDGILTVVWNEELHGRGAGLFAAQWSSTGDWKRFPRLEGAGADFALSPSVAVSTGGQPWVAWLPAARRSQRPLRAARWNGAEWEDLASAKLAQLTSPGLAARPSIGVLADDHAIIVWLQRTRGQQIPSLRMAHWDGRTWAPLQVPAAASQTRGFQFHVFDGVPTLAWIEEDSTGNSAVSVARMIDGRWTSIVTRLHVTPVTRSGGIGLVSPRRDSFEVFWLELGNGARAQVAEIYQCAANEQTPEIPSFVSPRKSWPKTVEDAATRVFLELSAEQRRDLARLDPTEINPDLLMAIRNKYGLWRGNNELLRSCGSGQLDSPEHCSSMILDAVLRRIHDACTDRK